jgi:hypothetical protein
MRIGQIRGLQKRIIRYLKQQRQGIPYTHLCITIAMGIHMYNPMGVKTQIDHLITNIKGKNIKSTYDWGFITESRYGQGVRAYSANKPKGLPDHAILKVNIVDIID